MADVIDMKTRRKERQAQSARDDLLEAADEFLDRYELRYVLGLGCYFLKNQRGEWFKAKPPALKPRFAEWRGDFIAGVTVKMEERGWMYNSVTYSFRDDLPNDVLNLLVRGNWVQPETGSHHWLFDVLIQSLGGDKAENMEHIEHIITHKHRLPATYTLPCMFFAGQGGIGKNVLVQSVLHTIFDGRTVVSDAANIIGSHNTVIAGKSWVMLDESKEDDKEDKLKQIVGNPTIVINPKGVDQYEAENTAAYIISSQNIQGGLRLDRSSADRRWSVMSVAKYEGELHGKNTLEYWIAVNQGWITASAAGDTLKAACKRAMQWMVDEGHGILNDRQQCAYWLGGLYAKHGDKPQPMALHGEDYESLMGAQTSTDDMVIEAVFNDVDFTHIGRTTLYRGYHQMTKEQGHNPTGAARFNVKVEAWLKTHKPEIELRRIRQKDFGTAVGKQEWLWMNVNYAREAGKDNNHRYFSFTSWIGPSI